MKKVKILSMVLAVCLMATCFGTAAVVAETPDVITYEDLVSLGTCTAGDIAGTIANLTDGQLYYVEMGGAGKYAILDLGQEYNLSKIVIHNRQEDEYRTPQFYNYLTVEISSDKSAWTPIDLSSATKNELKMTCATPGNARYIKVTVNNIAWLVLSEIEAYALKEKSLVGNIALGASVISTDTYEGSKASLVNLTDGSSTSGVAEIWGTANAYMQVDLGTELPITYLRLSTHESHLSNFDVQLSKTADFSNPVTWASYTEASPAPNGDAFIPSLNSGETYRYIRIQLTNGKSGMGILELEAYAKGFPSITELSNIALGKTVVHGGTGAATPESLTNGVLNDFAESWGSAGNYMQVDLGDYYKIDYVNVIPANEYHNDRFSIQLSDNSAFVNAVTIAEYSTESKALERNVNVAENKNKDARYRYVRLQYTGDRNDLAISELEVYPVVEAQTTGHANLAYGQKVLATSFTNPANLTDGNFETFSEGTGGGKNAVVVLDKPYQLSNVVVVPRIAITSDGYKPQDSERSDFKVEIATDAAFTDKIEYVQTGKIEDCKSLSIPVNDNKAYRYIRISQTDATYTLLTEVMAYGKDSIPAKVGGTGFTVANGMIADIEIAHDASFATNSELLVAVYDSDNRMTGVKHIDALQSKLDWTGNVSRIAVPEGLSFTAGGKVKVFCWAKDIQAQTSVEAADAKDIRVLRPICSADFLAQ